MSVLDNPRHEAFAQALASGKTADEAAAITGFPLRPCHSKLAGYYVYMLVDPRDGMVFYVGKGVRTRYAAHYREWLNGNIVNGRKFERIDDIARSGYEPEAYVVQDDLTENAALDLERNLIRCIGRKILTNALHGQMSDDAKAKAWCIYMLRRFKPYDTWLSERPRDEISKKTYWVVVDHILEEIDRLIAIGIWPTAEAKAEA